MKISKNIYAGLFWLACLSSLTAQQTSPSGTHMVTVGDPGNQPDNLKQGAVDTTYQIGAYEWTVQDWVTMLNTIASNPDPSTKTADPHHLWNKGMEPWVLRAGVASTGYRYGAASGCGKLPITNVNIYDCARACNFMQNRSLLPLALGVSMDSITEHGAYEITQNSDGTEIATLTEDATYFIPTNDQWIKAAFYQGGSTHAAYWMYPTRSNTNPGDATGKILDNKANYDLFPLWYWAPALVLTEVDALGKVDSNGNDTGTYSPYGCFDMAGNVNEWTTTTDKTGNYIVRGGSYASEYYDLANNDLMREAAPKSFSPKTRSNTLGFRMAAVESSDPSAVSHNHGASDSTAYSGWNPVKHSDQLTTAEQELPLIVVGTAIVAVACFFCPPAAVATGTESELLLTAGADAAGEAAAAETATGTSEVIGGGATDDIPPATDDVFITPAKGGAPDSNEINLSPNSNADSISYDDIYPKNSSTDSPKITNPAATTNDTSVKSNTPVVKTFVRFLNSLKSPTPR